MPLTGVQVAVRTSDGVEIRDSYVERQTRPTPVRHSEHIHRTSTSMNAKSREYHARPENSAEPEIVLNSSWSSLPRQSTLPPIVMQAVIGVNFIADHLKQQDEFNKVCVRYNGYKVLVFFSDFEISKYQ